MTTPSGEEVPVVHEHQETEAAVTNEAASSQYEDTKALSKSSSTENSQGFFSDVLKTMSRSSSVTDERWPHLVVTQRFKEYEQSLNKCKYLNMFIS